MFFVHVMCIFSYLLVNVVTVIVHVYVIIYLANLKDSKLIDKLANSLFPDSQ